MAVFRLKDPEEWLPKFSKGKAVPARKIVLHKGDGTRFTINVPSAKKNGGYEFEVTDERVIRHLTADPRFVRVS